MQKKKATSNSASVGVIFWHINQNWFQFDNFQGLFILILSRICFCQLYLIYISQVWLRIGVAAEFNFFLQIITKSNKKYMHQCVADDPLALDFFIIGLTCLKC